MKRITVVTSHDWMAVYINNELFEQDEYEVFNIEKLDQFLNELGLEPEIEMISDDALDEFFDENGSLPETLKEVRRVIAKGTSA